MSACRSCGAQVLWVPTGKTKPDGKPVLQILDAEPAKGVVLTHRTDGSLCLAPEDALTENLALARVVDVYTSHFATCPNAQEHRQ